MKFFIFITIAISLFAGPPMKSSDPFVPSIGQYEINLSIEFEKKNSTLVRAPIIDFNYGIIENVQFTLESSYIISDSQKGFDSLEVAFKWPFYRGEIVTIGLNPKYISYPVDSIFNEGKVYELTIPMNFSLAQNIDLIADVTYVYPLDGVKHLEYGTYLKFSQNKHTYFSEVFFEDSPHTNELFTLVDLGYMYQFHKNIAFMISLGKEIIAEDKKAVIGYSGLQFVY